jgi:thiol-disulfide isomerase/thioredoxin
MKNIIFGLILFLLISCNQKEEQSFLLEGKTNGIENGTILYLKDNLAEKIIDSTIVTNNQFTLNTKIQQFPFRVLLYNKEFSQWRDLWLENNKMTFDASKNDFKNANISGSKSQDLTTKLYKNSAKISWEEKNELEKKFVSENPNSIVSAFILSVFSKDWGADFTKENYNKFSEEIKSSEYGKRILNYIDLNKGIKIGSRYADFEITDKNGKNKRLSEFLGEITLLEFWASWCGPCRKENPNLVKTYKKYKPKGFEIFAISLDKDKDKWLKAIEKDNLEWPNFCDLQVWENEASLTYGVYAIPENFLIDKNGEIVARNIRGEELNEKLALLFK